MNKNASAFALACVLLGACTHAYVQNPDPSHTHADFAIWIDGKKVDFASAKYMSGSSTDEHTHDEAGEYLDEHLHLHDGNGNVLHAHKPGLTLRNFFTSLGVKFSKKGLNLCVAVPEMKTACEDEAMHRNWVMVVNGEVRPFFDVDYAFADMDKILMVLPKEAQSEDLPEVWEHWVAMTDDACLYSRTCPWRGDPPTENCIADPAVPCVEVPE